MSSVERSLSHADDDLDMITSILNHDARSPLVSVMGFLAELKLLHAETLEEWSAQEENAKERARLTSETLEAFAYLDEGARRMARVLEVLSELGGFRRRVLSVEPIDAASLVQEVAASLRDTVPEFALTVSSLPAFESDRSALLLVLGHVLHNAVRFCRPDVAPAVRISAESLEDRFVLRVTDNGRGIAEGQLLRVFRPFVRLAPLQGTGDGLGLAYARGLARRLGGDLRAECADSHGTTVLLELPLEAPTKYARAVA